MSSLSLTAWADSYTPLEWIDWQGTDVENSATNFTNYYDTEYVPVFATKVEFKCLSYGSDIKYRAICYGRNSWKNGLSIFSSKYIGKFAFFVGGEGDLTQIGDFWPLTEYSVTADASSMTVNGEQIGSPDPVLTAENYNATKEKMTLFGGTTDWPFRGRIYYFKIWEGEKLLHNFEPVLKNNTTPCFHCTVCDNYLEPHGTGFGHNALTKWASADYIECPKTESNIQHNFDTGYIVKENTKIVTKFMVTNNDGLWAPVFCGRDGKAGTGMSLYKNKDNKNLGYFVGNHTNDAQATFETNKEYVAECTLSSLKLNGTEYGTKEGTTWKASTRSVTLFSNPEKDNTFFGRIYYFKIYEGETLVHDFEPMAATDGSVGFYDTVDKRYITMRSDGTEPHFIAGVKSLELNETNDNSVLNMTAMSVKLTRTLKAGRWNTFCIPFSMPKEKFGEGAQVKELTAAAKNGENYTLTFSDASTIEAGKPYMVKVASDISRIELNDNDGIIVNSTTEPSFTVDDVTFHGTYSSGKAPMGSFIISNNKFYNVNSDVSLMAFRGYITVAGAEVKALDFILDDDATGLEMDNLQMYNVQTPIYNLNGLRIQKVQKGINIINGKKVLY